MGEETVDFDRIWSRIDWLLKEVQAQEGLRITEWPLFYYCIVCDKTFPGGGMSAHMATHHPDEKVSVECL